MHSVPVGQTASTLSPHSAKVYVNVNAIQESTDWSILTSRVLTTLAALATLNTRATTAIALKLNMIPTTFV